MNTCKRLDIFTTPYVVNIARELGSVLITMGVDAEVYTRDVTNSDISRCTKDKGLYMFLFCPQWVAGEHLHLDPLPPEKYYIYQLEQFDKSNSPHIMNEFVLSLMKRSKHIFDYSKVNLQYYKTFAGTLDTKVSHLIPPAVQFTGKNINKDIDVLFVGCSSSRRAPILKYLTDNGIGVVHLINCFGDDLTNAISSSKIFLNIRYSDSKILETCRIHEALMSSDTCIVSEKPGHEIEDEMCSMYGDRVCFVDVIDTDYTQLHQSIVRILSNYDDNTPGIFTQLPPTQDVLQGGL